MLRCTESRKFIYHPHDNAMTSVHEYDLHSVSIVFHYSVGFDIAYPRMVGNARAPVHGISKTVCARALFVVSNEKKYYGNRQCN